MLLLRSAEFKEEEFSFKGLTGDEIETMKMQPRIVFDDNYLFICSKCDKEIDSEEFI